MATSLIAEDGNERQHRPSLRKLLGAATSVRVASAYVTDTELLLSIKRGKVQLLTSLVRMDIVSGATSLRALRSLIQAGVQCRSFSGGGRLHAKVYIFGDQSAVVTSANLTRNGLDSNIEVGCNLFGREVKELAAWFDAFWKKAGPIDLQEVSEWEQDTESRRRDYAALRNRAGDKPRRQSEALPFVRSQVQLRELLDKAPRFFVCNTNRRWSLDAEELMRQKQYAAVWEDFKYPTHMERVRQGDAIFMFAKGVGIVGVGRASAGREILESRDPGRIRNPNEYDGREWRIPVEDWLVWVEHDAEACPCTIPNASFVDVSGAGYHELREAACKRFLRDS